MQDFDATNLLSDDKHSDYENSYDKNHFYKNEYKETGQKQDKLKSAGHQRKHDPLRTQDILEKHSASYINDKLFYSELALNTNKEIKSSLKPDDNVKVSSKANEKVTQIVATNTENIQERTETVKHFIEETTFTNIIKRKSKFPPTGYAVGVGGTRKNNSPTVTSSTTFGGDTLINGKEPNKIMATDFSDDKIETRNVLYNEGTAKAAPPYITALASSVAILAVVLVIFFIILLYKRRYRRKPVISDEMYSAYKLNKKMRERSPMPSPRGSEQESSPEIDFITADSSRTHLTWETTTLQETGESVYLELDDDSRYDYATAPVTP